MNPPDTAPKDRMFLGHFNFPWLVPTVWNSYTAKWTYATLQAQDMGQDDIHDFWFETENEDENELLGWLPLPSADTIPVGA